MSIKIMKMAISAAEVADLYIKGKITGLENRKRALRFLAKSNAQLRAAIDQAKMPWVKTYAGGKPVYTAPRQWQGLTEEEKSSLVEWAHPDIIDALELKLRERNGG